MNTKKSEEVLLSFEPVVPDHPKVLILGSMPGEESLRKQQYYGHPQNAFWFAISSLAGLEIPPKRYNDKIQLLHKNHIALWDVCHECIRKGSLDGDIKKPLPNEVNKLLKEHPSITIVLFNGQTPEKLYKKFFKYIDGITYKQMPSTSPAFASLKRDLKINMWSQEMFVCFLCIIIFGKFLLKL
ncbi:hypothetical protein EIN_176720 [Entamoeba invadens IP1]|uniref:hypothetical protein n=1 Tax=Entamoeba invadens IP1 TaxID=370355 RepID=UPI0002C3CEC2|nr:hypothetical protein EIN_176720 [Entamoeba invadens IP1]ELP93845.1 hypothetical protein EIN_176720 [Entamoeba invadens IP1]|eukprot:XP_004260616.1 hypothetical protein EIN_176720 [Entamoeba invadens IP1]